MPEQPKVSSDQVSVESTSRIVSAPSGEPGISTFADEKTTTHTKILSSQPSGVSVPPVIHTRIEILEKPIIPEEAIPSILEHPASIPLPPSPPPTSPLVMPLPVPATATTFGPSVDIPKTKTEALEESASKTLKEAKDTAHKLGEVISDEAQVVKEKISEEAHVVAEKVSEGANTFLGAVKKVVSHLIPPENTTGQPTLAEFHRKSIVDHAEEEQAGYERAVAPILVETVSPPLTVAPRETVEIHPIETIPKRDVATILENPEGPFLPDEVPRVAIDSKGRVTEADPSVFVVPGEGSPEPHPTLHHIVDRTEQALHRAFGEKIPEEVKKEKQHMDEQAAEIHEREVKK